MKKLLLIMLALVMASFTFVYADTVQVGTGTSTSSYLPLYGLYGYNYTQQIYTQAQIGVAGNITKIRFYYVSGTITNSKDWVVYMGHTTKTTFATTTDWEPLANLTQVFAGDVTSLVPLANNWMEITLSTPFAYNNTDNLIVAVDENTAGYASMSWGAFTSGTNTGIYYYSDTINPDPAAPPTASSRTATIDRMQFVFPNSAAPLAPTLVAPFNGGWALTGDKLYWTPTAGVSDANTYDVYFGTAANPPLVSDNQAATNYTPTLAPGTTYYWKVVASNEIGDSPASAIWSFMTPGATQLVESFENTTFPPAGWANPGTWSRGTSYYKHGTAGAYKSGSTTSQYVLSTPKVTITASSTLNFWAAGSSTTAANLQVVYSPDRVTWTQIGSNITYAATYTFYNQVIDLSSLAGNNYYLGFRTGTAGSSTSYIDMVFGPEITPEAPGPVTLSTPADLATGVNELPSLSWTAPTTGGVPTGYKLYVDTVNPPVAQVADLNALTYTLNTPLAYNTTYYWSVAAYNGAGTGPQAAVRSFTTRANPTITTLPFTEGFETGNTDAQPVALWSSVYVTGTKNWTANSTATSYNRTPRTGSFNAFLGWSASTWMIRPVQLTGGTSYDVEVFARQDNADTALANMTIAYGTSGTAAGMTNIIVPQTGLTNGDYQRLIGSFTPPSTGVYYIGILGTLPTTTNWYVSIDDITIRETPEGAPEAVTLNGPTDEAPSVSVMPTFTWTASLNGATPTGYDLYLDTTDGSTLFAEGVSSPYTLVNALPYSTEHFWTVVAYNGTGDGPAAAVRSFTTMDDPTVSTFPWTEGFDSVTAPALPMGWTSIDNNADADAWVTAASNPHTGTNAARIYTDYNEANDDYLVTPPIQLTGNQRLKFWTRAHSAGEPDEISVLLSTTTPTVGAFTNVLMASTPVNYVTYTEYEIDLSAYSGSCYIAFARNAAPADGWYLYVDDVTVEDIPAGPVFSISPTEWNFGSTLINSTSSKLFTITNAGVGTLTINTVAVSGDYFALAEPFVTANLGTGESATFTVNYNPSAVGTHTGTVTITDARAVSTVDLEGTCYDPTQPLPYTQDFNGGTSLTAINWAGDMYIATPHGTDGSNGLYRNLYSSVPSCNAITPPIGPMITNAQLKFDYRFVNWSSYPANATPLGAGDNLQIQVSTDAGASYTTVYTIDQSNHVTSTSFANVSVSLAAYTTGSIMIRFLGTRANGDYYLDIDNVIVQEAPAGAPNPVTLNNPANEATGLPQNGFNLTWTPAQTGGTPTYYGVFMSQDEATIYEDVYFETTATLLNPTTYAGGPSSPITFNYEDRWYWTVQAINDDGDALVEPAYWFNIESDPTISAFPYQESFETHADNTLPSGWTRSSLATGWEFGSDLSSSYWDIPTHTVYAAANDDAAGSSGDGSMDILTMPPINLSGANPGAPVLTFDSYYDGSYSQLAYVEASTDGSTWTNIYDVPTGTDWVAQTVSLVDYNGMNPVYVRFHSDDNGSWASGWAIDNVALIYSTVDIYAPVVDHYPTIGWPLLNTPIDITANVTDNPVMTSGIASVTLYYTINAGAETSIPMTLSGANYTAAIPGQPAGTTVAYYIVAVDAAPTPNTTTTATWDFVVDVPVTLQYDSGTSTTGLGLATGTLGVMTGFTNPYGAGNPIQINSVSAGMNNAGTANVHVFTYDSVNDVLVDVIPSFSQAFAAGVYLNIPLTNCVTTAGYFYVAFTDVVAPNYFSFDQTQPYYPGTHFIFFGSGYDLANLGTVEGSGFAGSWLIRAEVQAGVTTLETPAVSTSSVPTGVELSWNAITGANGYKVLASSDPYTADPWTELAFITGTTYTYTGVDNVKFFKVLATSDSPTRNAFVSSSRKSSSTRPALRAAQVRNVSIMPKPKQ